MKIMKEDDVMWMMHESRDMMRRRRRRERRWRREGIVEKIDRRGGWGKNRGGTRNVCGRCDRGQTEQERRDSPFGFSLSLPVHST